MEGEQKKEHCQFYLPKKGRFCRFQPKPNHQYCPEHACILGIHIDRKRIPCPLNPSHNCYEDNLKAHLKKCNVTKLRQATEQSVYFVKDINKISSLNADQEPSKKVVVSELSSESLGALINKVNQLYDAHVEKMDTVVMQHPCVQEEFGSQDVSDLSQVLSNQATLQKELLQQASLIGQLESLHLLKDDHCFVEMGAGKGKLSHWVQKACKDCKNTSFLLVDRSSVRYKMDGFHKQDDGESNFRRIKVDIADLCLGYVPDMKEQKSVVVIGKHLCGGATDMGIKCAVDTLDVSRETHPFTDAPACANKSSSNASKPVTCSSSINKEEKNPHVESSSSIVHHSQHASTDEDADTERVCKKSAGTTLSHTVDSQTENSDEPSRKAMRLTPNTYERKNMKLPKGIMIALCCHHRCDWNTYIGKEFMKSCDLSSQEFDLLTRLSSWATCARGKDQLSQRSRVKDLELERSIESTQGISEQAGQDGKHPEKVSVEKEEEKFSDPSEEHSTQDLMDIEQGQPLRESLSVQEREKIGRKCKRLIDTGRLLFLRSRGMKCCLREYIGEDLTPENIVLLAYSTK